MTPAGMVTGMVPGMVTDPAITFLGPAQQAAVAKLVCAVAQPRGVALLCGPAGVGKTTVLGQVAAAIGGSGPIGPPEIAAVASRPPSTRDAAVPRIILADDAHTVAESDLLALVDYCVRCSAGLVLSGAGRLLTLVARQPRLERVIGMRVVLQPFGFADSLAVVSRRLPATATASADGLAAVARTIHDIAGGIPADVVRLADLAALVAEARPGQPLAPLDIEAIHRRLGLRAA